MKITKKKKQLQQQQKKLKLQIKVHALRDNEGLTFRQIGNKIKRTKQRAYQIYQEPIRRGVSFERDMV